MQQIKETQKDLYDYLTENPTVAQARSNVRNLASKFREDLAAEQKAIAAKESAFEEEMKTIEKQGN